MTPVGAEGITADTVTCTGRDLEPSGCGCCGLSVEVG